jgi:RNA polymerase sigma-70 factor (ECF subfamily)
MNVNRDPRAAELEELIARVAMQDRAAFDRLYEIASPRLFAVAMRISKSQAEAEEICQDAFVRVWQRAETFRPGDANPLSWMTAITRNLAIDRIRRTKMPTVPVEMAESVPDDTLTPEGAVGAAQMRAQIDECLGELDESHAGAVRSAYIEGYSYRELAERYETPLNTMRTWLRRSLIRLRSCLELEG